MHQLPAKCFQRQIGKGEGMVTFAHVSAVGGREKNDDCIGTAHMGPEQGFYILADGLGGHRGGEVASRTAADLCRNLYPYHYNDPDLLSLCFTEAQKAIREKIGQDPSLENMRTTLVLLWQEGSRFSWGHIGDSRLYYFREGKFAFRTVDDSVPQMLLNLGEIKEDELASHPDRNRLLAVLGSDTEEVGFHLSEPVIIGSQDAFLLCTDGFWEHISEKEMEKALKKCTDVSDWLVRMEETVLKNSRPDNRDNYSALAVLPF